MPETEEETPESGEEEAPESGKLTKAEAEMKLFDAETFTRHAWDLIDDLAAAGVVPKELLAKFEALHDELSDLLPED